MTTTTVDAVYREGVFKPLTPISLPENAPVKLIIEQAEPPEPTGIMFSSLFGAFPELRGIPDDDIVRVQRLWGESLEKQIRFLQADDERS